MSSQDASVQVAGDRARITVSVPWWAPLSAFIPDWAQRCSSTPADQLALVCWETGVPVGRHDTLSSVADTMAGPPSFILVIASTDDVPSAGPGLIPAESASEAVAATSSGVRRKLRTVADLGDCPVQLGSARPSAPSVTDGGIGDGSVEDRPWTQAFVSGEPSVKKRSPVGGSASWRGWRRPGGGHHGYVRPISEYVGTTVQTCGLWPFALHGSLPALGVPVGVHERTGQPVCVDPLAWFKGGITSSPSAAVFGLNGLGKSSLNKRWIVGWVDQGVIPIVASDVKPDYPRLIRSVGGTVVEAGAGQVSINVLDISVSLAAADRLETETADPEVGRQLAARIRAAAIDARNTVLAGLVAINRGTTNAYDAGIRDWEKALIDVGTVELDRRHPPGEAVLADLIDLIEEGTPALHAQVAEAADEANYRIFVKPFVRSLRALTSGALGATFAGQTTIALDVTRPLTVDISAIGKANAVLKAAVMLSCWAKVMLDVETLHTLADGGLEPRRQFAIIFEELWHVIGAAGGMVDRLDELSRLNRTFGTATVMLFHSLVDFQKLKTAEERAAANGLVERCGVLCVFGVPKKELEAIGEVVELTAGERSRLASWKAEAAVDPETGRAGRPPGMGRFLVKTSARAGTPVRLDLLPQELELYNTNERWDMAGRQ